MFSRIQHYKLKHRKPKKCSMLSWGRFMGRNRIRSSNINGYFISTVFLGMEHSGGMFETMVFSEKQNDSVVYSCRSDNHKGALENHKSAKFFVLNEA